MLSSLNPYLNSKNQIQVTILPSDFNISLETKSGRILRLTYAMKYEST